jgi:hypothetical protein
MLGLTFAKDVDHLHINDLVLVAFRLSYTDSERESGKWVCVSDR